jgi:hypothetical protein
MDVWFLTIFPMAALAVVLFLGSPHIPIWTLWVYAWIPGGLALLWSHFKNVKIPIFPRNGKYLWLSLCGSGIGALSFFISLFFSGYADIELASVNSAVFYLFSCYFLFLVLFFILFLGGEICWRGYLWKLWDNSSPKGWIATWLLWSLWLAPITALSKNFIVGIFLNFSLMPFLHFFRLRSQSIIPGTLFYASIFASFIYFQMLFSSPQNYLLLSAILGSVLLIISLIFLLSKRV